MSSYKYQYALFGNVRMNMTFKICLAINALTRKSIPTRKLFQTYLHDKFFVNGSVAISHVFQPRDNI